jgi:hypothetical protein
VTYASKGPSTARPNVLRDETLPNTLHDQTRPNTLSGETASNTLSRMGPQPRAKAPREQTLTPQPSSRRGLPRWAAAAIVALAFIALLVLLRGAP